MDVIGLAYSGLIFSGGALGYFKAGSLYSLVSGVIFGLSSLYGSYKIGRNPKNVYVLLATSVILGSIMSYRFYKTHKFFPAGVVSAFSVLMVIRCILRLMDFNVI